MARYVNGREPAPALRDIMKNGVRLSIQQCEEFEDSVDRYGGWPQGVPQARSEFEGRYKVQGKAWVRKESD